VVFAPGKGTYFPEYIPDSYNPEQRDTTNYDYLLNACREQGIEHIDFNSWFCSLKDTISYPLYPQCGIHWSYYGSALALDSLIGYMEHLGSRKMIDFGWSDIEISDNLRDPDYDIADGMNLLFRIGCYDMAYPKLYFKEDSTTFKPSVITIADSYYWIFHGKGITQRIYENDNFWYYYQEANGDRYKDERNLQNIDRLDEFKIADYIVLLITDANLYKFAFGFIDDAFYLLSDETNGSEPDEALIEQYINTIRNNPEWYKSIEEKAKINKISVEEMLRRDAIWLINQESNK
jgi:hypothetical protein